MQSTYVYSKREIPISSDLPPLAQVLNMADKILENPILFPKAWNPPGSTFNLPNQSLLQNPNKVFLKLDRHGEWGLGIRDPTWGKLMGLENAPHKVMASGGPSQSGMGDLLKGPLYAAGTLVSFG